MKVPLIKHRRTGGEPKKTLPSDAALDQLRARLVSIAHELRTSNVTYSRQRLVQAIAELDALREPKR